MASPSTTDAITFLPTNDLQATKEFYLERLGLPLVADQGVCLIFKVTDAAYFGFCSHLQTITKPDSVILTIVADDPDAWHRHCQHAGIETDSPPKLNKNYGIYHFFARDPNGYRVEFQRFDDPNWRVPANETGV